MQNSGIGIEINGELIDLARVDWFQKAPCGCVSGCTLGYSDLGTRDPHVVATADAAWKQFYETKAERKKYADLGFTVFADLRSKVQELMGDDCLHKPKWGYEKPPRPEGMTWAGARTSRVLHLVAEVTARSSAPAGEARAMCGTPSYSWSDGYWYTDGKVECKKCIQAARSLISAEVA